VTTNVLYIISLPQIDTEHIPRLLVLRSDQELFAAETPATVQVLGLELYIALVWYGTRGGLITLGLDLATSSILSQESGFPPQPPLAEEQDRIQF
jgi:hypothetical protein